LAQSTTSQLVSEEAVAALARIAKESSEALSYLKTLAKSGNEIAIVQLARVGSDDSHTLTILQTLAQSGNETAMAEVVRVGSHKPSSLPILKNIVQSSLNHNLKREAIGALIRYWKKDPHILLPWLQKLARSGDEAAIKGLTQNWKDSPQTLSIIKTLARSGHKVAIEELAWNWQDDRDTLVFLQTLATLGIKPAALELALHWIDAPKTLDILRTTINHYGNIDDQLVEPIYKGKTLTILILTADKDNIADIQALFRTFRMERRGVESGHFSTLRSKIKDPECLKRALHSLGRIVKTDADVRGSNGKRVRCDVVCVLEGNYDVGWLCNSDGSLDLIIDCWGVQQKYNQTELINSINQRYAAMIRGYKRFVN
jgi:hypothetical protein